MQCAPNVLSRQGVSAASPSSWPVEAGTTGRAEGTDSLLRHQSRDQPVFRPSTNQARAHDADREDRVADDAQPAQRVHQRRLQELGGAGVPDAVLDAAPRSAAGRPAAELISTISARPMLIAQKAKPAARGPPRVPMGASAREAEQHQADAEHAVDAEQRGVAVHAAWCSGPACSRARSAG